MTNYSRGSTSFGNHTGAAGGPSYQPPNPTFQNSQGPDLHTPFQTNTSPSRHSGALSSPQDRPSYPRNPSSSDSYFSGGAGEQARKDGQYSPGQTYGNTNSSGNYQPQTSPYSQASSGITPWDMSAANGPRGVGNSPQGMHDNSMITEGFGVANRNSRAIPGNGSSFGIANNNHIGFGQTQPAGQIFSPTIGFGYRSNTANNRTDTFPPNNLGLSAGHTDAFANQTYNEGYTRNGFAEDISRNTPRGGANGFPLPFGPTSSQPSLPPFHNSQQPQFGVPNPATWPRLSTDNPRSTQPINTVPGSQGLSSSISGWANTPSIPSDKSYGQSTGDINVFGGVPGGSTFVPAQARGLPGVPRAPGASPLPPPAGKQQGTGATVQRRSSWDNQMKDDSMDDEPTGSDKKKHLMDNQARSREKRKDALKFLQEAVLQTLGSDEQTNNRKLPEADLIMLAAKKLISNKQSEEQLKRELTEICADNQLIKPGEQLSRRDLTRRIEKALPSPGFTGPPQPNQYNALPEPVNQYQFQ
ncbi:hypothetical protein SISNIDRAFT_495967 [Sistotremastrum niveocremeum HHB9708]|uniref:Uncharacterized protein n=2 Tax=Sistotremastraceae TaxID=3402574 RepID=A0A164U0F7_9AGAM|nr:hypothetical protein SISNIDRAFT_495967 [Sistotremastrum niveocremeum HHB9708]KZT35286.1 hypothetical protein SISSUDRAFT_1121703 [Sistotremastrum suecicum HHB10207 ss-3]